MGVSSGPQIHHPHPTWMASNKHPELFPGLGHEHGFPARGPYQPPHVGLRPSGSGVSTGGGVSRTFPDLGRGDLGEKARNKLSERSCGPTPRVNLSEAKKDQDMAQGILAPAHAWLPASPPKGCSTGPALSNTPQETRRKRPNQKAALWGYGSPVDLVADVLDSWGD